jgi:hypothetical protein
MAFGFATLCSKDLRLGEFATPDHAGISIQSLKYHIDTLRSMKDFQVSSNSKNSNAQLIVPGGKWDLKKQLQKAIRDLKMEQWGLDYDKYRKWS